MRSPPQDVAQEVTACRVAARYLTSTSSSASRFEPSIVTAAHRLIYMFGQEFDVLPCERMFRKAQIGVVAASP